MYRCLMLNLSRQPETILYYIKFFDYGFLHPESNHDPWAAPPSSTNQQQRSSAQPPPCKLATPSPRPRSKADGRIRPHQVQPDRRHVNLRTFYRIEHIIVARALALRELIATVSKTSSSFSG